MINSGKLHNLAKALALEEAESNYHKEEGADPNKIALLNPEKGAFVGLGLKPSKSSSSLDSTTAESTSEISEYEMKDSGKRFFGPVTAKPPTFLSAFVIYIATIGDIVDGVDTTHDFNFFSLVYEWPKDVRNLGYSSFFIQVSVEPKFFTFLKCAYITFLFCLTYVCLCACVLVL